MEPHLFISNSIILYLLPFDVENSPDSTVVEAFNLSFVFCRQVPRFTTPENSVHGVRDKDIKLRSDVYNIFIIEEVLSVGL
jgi:hypothetical protein